jgi:diacylglycerol kinase (ATP)
MKIDYWEYRHFSGASMRTILILNPASGASTMASNHHTLEENQKAIVAALHAAGLEEVETRYTTPEDSGYGLARQAAQEGADLVIAAGGDGTLHAVASGLIGTNSTLGIIAVGTMNNIAHSLDIAEDITEACEIIANGATCYVDVGKINGQLFLEVAGIGLEAALFPAAEEFKSPGLASSLHGAIRGLFTLLKFKPTRFRASFDGHKVRSFKAIQISICNTPYYGAHLRFAPDAVMDDGLLDVLIYKNFSKLDYIRHAISISQGRRALKQRISRRKVKSLAIYADQPVEIHADGEIKGQTPARVEIEPGILRVRVPKHIVASPNIRNQATRRNQHMREAQGQKLIEERDTSWQATRTNQ